MRKLTTIRVEEGMESSVYLLLHSYRWWVNEVVNGNGYIGSNGGHSRRRMRSSVTKTPSAGSSMQGSEDSSVQGSEGSSVQGSEGSSVQDSEGSSVQGSEGSGNDTMISCFT